MADRQGSVIKEAGNLLVYAIVDAVRSGEPAPKEFLAKAMLKELGIAEEKASLLLLSEECKKHKENDLISTFSLLNSLLEDMLQKQKYDEQSLDIVKDTISALSELLTEVLQKYAIPDG